MRASQKEQVEKYQKPAGSELCQAQVQVRFLAGTELNVTDEIQIWVSLEKTYTHI